MYTILIYRYNSTTKIYSSLKSLCLKPALSSSARASAVFLANVFSDSVFPSPTPSPSPSLFPYFFSKSIPASFAASRGVIWSTIAAVCAIFAFHSLDPGTCPAKMSTEIAAPRHCPNANPLVAPSRNPTLKPACTDSFLPSSMPSRYPSLQN